eukprot:5299900-Pleurochrysis_carterae.AAC.1
MGTADASAEIRPRRSCACDATVHQSNPSWVQKSPARGRQIARSNGWKGDEQTGGEEGTRRSRVYRLSRASVQASVSVPLYA